jgi:glutathione S-transferase
VFNRTLPGMTRPVLWQYNFSNFNEKARWALDYKGIPHERRSLLPNMPRALWFSMRGTLPVLDLNGTRIVDSTRIIEALETHYPVPALYPAADDERQRALELEDFFDEHAGHELRRAAFYELRAHPEYVGELLTAGKSAATRRVFQTLISMPGSMAYANHRYRIYPDDVERAKVKVVAALDRIVAEAQPSGYLVGSSFTVADLTAAAVLFPLAWPPELQYPYPRPPSLELLDGLRTHPGVEWIGEMYRRHRGPSMAIIG